MNTYNLQNTILSSLLAIAISVTLPSVTFGAVTTVYASSSVATQASTIRSDIALEDMATAILLYREAKGRKLSRVLPL